MFLEGFNLSLGIFGFLFETSCELLMVKMTNRELEESAAADEIIYRRHHNVQYCSLMNCRHLLMNLGFPSWRQVLKIQSMWSRLS